MRGLTALALIALVAATGWLAVWVLRSFDEAPATRSANPAPSRPADSDEQPIAPANAPDTPPAEGTRTIVAEPLRPRTSDGFPAPYGPTTLETIEISGQALGEHGVVPETRIRLWFGQDGIEGTPDLVFTADAEGRFSETIEAPFPEIGFLELTCLASAVGFCSTQRSVLMSRRNDEDPLVIRMLEGGDLHGRVVLASGTPVALATVTLDGGIDHKSHTVATGKDGTYHLPFREFGTYALSARQEDTGASGPQPIHLLPAATHRAPDLVLKGSGEIGGRLRNASGEPPAGQDVTVQSLPWLEKTGWLEKPVGPQGFGPRGRLHEHETKGLLEATLTPDEDGRFLFRGLEPGRFVLTCGQGQPSHWLVDTGQKDLELTQLRPHLEVTFELPTGLPSGLDVSARLVDAESGEIQHTTGPPLGGRPTLEENRLVLEVVDGRTYDLLLTVSTRNGRLQAIERTVTIPVGQEKTRLSVPLSPKGPGSLHVSASGETDGCDVLADVRTSSGAHLLQTQQVGRNLAPQTLPAGDYLVSAYAPTRSSRLRVRLQNAESLPSAITDLAMDESLVAPSIEQRRITIHPFEATEVLLALRPAGAALLALRAPEDPAQPGRPISITRVLLRRSRLDHGNGAAVDDDLWDNVRLDAPNHVIYYVTRRALPPGTWHWTGETVEGVTVQGRFTIEAGKLTIAHASW